MLRYAQLHCGTESLVGIAKSKKSLKTVGFEPTQQSYYGDLIDYVNRLNVAP